MWSPLPLLGFKFFTKSRKRDGASGARSGGTVGAGSGNSFVHAFGENGEGEPGDEEAKADEKARAKERKLASTLLGWRMDAGEVVQNAKENLLFSKNIL